MDIPSHDEITHVLQNGRWFAGLPDDLRRFLVGEGRAVALPTGRVLFARGDAPDGLYAMLSGRARVATVSAAGREAILAMAEPPQWFGELALFDGRPRSHAARADVDSIVLHVPQAALVAMLEAHPGHWRWLGLLLADKLRHAFDAIEEAALLPPLGRVARRLIAMADGYGAVTGRPHRTLELPQEQLGLMLSLSRQTVNQLLGQLAASGAIRLARGGVELIDPDALRRVADDGR